jgi:hypothetical protein
METVKLIDLEYELQLWAQERMHIFINIAIPYIYLIWRVDDGVTHILAKQLVQLLKVHH